MDKYRIELFKKKIKDIFPNIEKMRLKKSVNGESLLFTPSDYIQKDLVRNIVSKGLNRNGIEYNEDELFIRIQIDQEALPERSNPQRGRE